VNSPGVPALGSPPSRCSEPGSQAAARAAAARAGSGPKNSAGTGERNWPAPCKGLSPHPCPRGSVFPDRRGVFHEVRRGKAAKSAGMLLLAAAPEACAARRLRCGAVGRSKAHRSCFFSTLGCWRLELELCVAPELEGEGAFVVLRAKAGPGPAPALALRVAYVGTVAMWQAP
jgi:hypothetical protein